MEEIHAYAKLLYLRSGRQFEDKTAYPELQGDVTVCDDGDDSNSVVNVALGDLDLDRLRRNFLDRLSETVSPKNGGRHVVASRMFYWPDQVKVFIAINSGFDESNSLLNFLSSLHISLKEIAAAPDYQTEKSIDSLWNILLRHQSSRLDTVIVDLRSQIKKNFQHFLPQAASLESTDVDVLLETERVVIDLEGWLKLLAKFLFADSISDIEKHNRLVCFSHTIYRSFPIEHFQALGRRGDKLRQAIGFLGRLRTSFRVLVTAARQLSGFGDLSLIPVVRPKTRKHLSNQEWSLSQTFRALDRQLNDVEVKNLMEQSSSKVKWTKNKLLRDFSKLKTPTSEVHAEIQLLLFILYNPQEVVNGKGLEYIGCSRYSCLLCSKFLHHFQALKTRGCHGKLYNHSWTIPPGEYLGKVEQPILSRAIKKVASWMRMELISSMKSLAQNGLELKESTIGSSLTAVSAIDQKSYQRSYAVSEHLRRQRAENAYMQFNPERLLDLVEDDEASSIENRDRIPSNSMVVRCTRCYELQSTRPCSHCNGAPFCSKACEWEMPLSHLLKCNMRRVTSADYLEDDVLADTLPTDSEVRRDYWFDRCQNKDEESHLFGVFAGLLKYHPSHITREELHQWRSHPDGNPYLVAEIIRKFEELPNDSMGNYFPWFRGHRARFESSDGDPSVLKALYPETQIEKLQDRVRKYLAHEDQHKDVKDLAPFAKMHCFQFYSMIGSNWHPQPLNSDYSHWFDFGFVVCNDQHEEGILGMYNSMLFGSTSAEDYARRSEFPNPMETVQTKGPTCSFDEFWNAWEKGELIAIFNKYLLALSAKHSSMLSVQRDLCTRLQVFFAFKERTSRPSIWKLRHFCFLVDVSVEAARGEIARGARDYGFCEKLDARTTFELRQFYMQLFKIAKPSTIHQERIKGTLLQYSRGCSSVITSRVGAILQCLL